MINLLEQDPVHIAGVLVKAFPQNCDAVTKMLNALPGTEVHEVSSEGSMVLPLSRPKKKRI